MEATLCASSKSRLERDWEVLKCASYVQDPSETNTCYAFKIKALHPKVQYRLACFLLKSTYNPQDPGTSTCGGLGGLLRSLEAWGTDSQDKGASCSAL